MHNITFVTSPHISASLKAINLVTDNIGNRPNKFCAVSSTIHRLCGHHHWQCAACSTVDEVLARSFR